jgi:hypothetical protein
MVQIAEIQAKCAIDGTRRVSCAANRLASLFKILAERAPDESVAANDEKPVHQAGLAPTSDERGVAQMAIK